MSEPIEPKLDPQQRDIETRLRQLKPRAARLAPVTRTPPPQIVPQRAIVGYAATWAFGVVVGCLLMVLLRSQEKISRPTPVGLLTTQRRAEPTTPPVTGRQAEVVQAIPRATGENAGRVDAILRTKPGQDRLQVGSHLSATVAFTPRVLRTVAVIDAGRAENESARKTRQQLMKELLEASF